MDSRRWVLLLVCMACGVPVFWLPLAHTWNIWMTSPEYNYGPIIPLIAAMMVWRDLRRSAVPGGRAPLGIALVALALVFGLFGQIAAFVFLAQIALFLFVIGLFIAFTGDARAWSVWPGLGYLAFSVPMAKLLQAALSAKLQIISSELGVMFIRIFDIPVFLEGNLIDLGAIQLQVAEACSGLRYLFPLASFSYLCAYLMLAPRWQKVVIFLSALPLTIILNSLRIGLTGILADRFGLAAATGFFHDFEGWLVFCSCIAVLFLEMKLLCLVGGGERSLLKRMDLSWPPANVLANPGAYRRATSIAVAAAVSVIGTGLFFSLGSIDSLVPPRESFSTFPRELGAWQAVEAPVDQASLDLLKTSDRLSLNFGAPNELPINVWVAYYATQEIGEAIHSPQVCMPGGGWQITDMRSVPLTDTPGSGFANRAIIAQRDTKQLVYYWFQGRGRTESSEYTAKLSVISDSLLRHRTDGALVRLVVPIDPVAGVAPAEAKLRTFIEQFEAQLGPYLPE